MSAMRMVSWYPTRREAQAAMFDYAAALTERGDTARFAVSVRRLPKHGWGVFLRDRAARGRAVSDSGGGRR